MSHVDVHFSTAQHGNSFMK